MYISPDQPENRVARTYQWRVMLVYVIRLLGGIHKAGFLCGQPIILLGWRSRSVEENLFQGLKMAVQKSPSPDAQAASIS